MPFGEINGTSLYYESHGEGLPVIFVHGAGGNHASWFYQIDEFSTDHRVIAYDQRGFGRSEDHDGRGQAAMVDDLAGLMDHLGLARAVLVAQSLGGGTCAGYTVRSPERVAGLVLSDTLAALDLPEEIANQAAEVSKQTTGLPQVIRVLGPKTRDRSPSKAVLYTELASFNTYRVGAIPGRFARVDRKVLEATGVPLMFVVGEDDILCPPRIVRLVKDLFADATLAEIPEVGHSAYFEDPATYNRHLREFLTSLNSAHP